MQINFQENFLLRANLKYCYTTEEQENSLENYFPRTQADFAQKRTSFAATQSKELKTPHIWKIKGMIYVGNV